MSRFASVQDLSWCISTNNQQAISPKALIKVCQPSLSPELWSGEAYLNDGGPPHPSTRARLSVLLSPTAHAPSRRGAVLWEPCDQTGVLLPPTGLHDAWQLKRAHPSSQELQGVGRFGTAASVAERVQHQHLPLATF